MTEFLSENHLLGLTIGAVTCLVIGLFHPLVIKGEYYFGVRCWWAFLIGGLAAGGASLAVTDFFWQTLLAVAAFSCFWSILEVFEQRERVRKGWFPANPRRANGNPSLEEPGENDRQ